MVELALRAFAGRELQSGRGEWELEAQYSSTKDIENGSIDPTTFTACSTVTTCYGSTTGTVISLNGTIYYRINRDWFLIGQLSLSQTSLSVASSMTAAGVQVNDPAIDDLTGYFRIAYRF